MCHLGGFVACFSIGTSDGSLICARHLCRRERLTCDGFSLIETVHFGSLEFITDCFNGLSLCPKGSNPGVVFVGTTHNGSSSLWAMIEDSTEEFYTASNGEGSSGIPVS
jgi:hypothetical protein